MRSAFRRIVGKSNLVQVVSSDPPPVTGPVDAPTEYLLKCSLAPLSECSVVAELSHPAFSSTEPRFWAGMHWMWLRGLTVRIHRVHESFRFAAISEVASSSARLQVTEEGGLGERLPANTTGSLDAPSPEALDRSLSALGLSPPLVLGDGLDAVRILEAWYDEHDLRNWSKGAGGRQFARVPF